MRELTVNYRTPVEIMSLAAAALARVGPDLRVPRSVRESGVSPWQSPISEVKLPSVVDDELAAADGGTVGVLCPPEWLDRLRADLPDDERLSLSTVDDAKGLEFDGVVVIAPEEIVAGSPRGWNDLYVALTRATRRLGIVHAREDWELLAGEREIPG